MIKKEEYLKKVDEFRDTIPNTYNQINLVDELFNDDLDYYISISTRTDGKTFNYFAFFLMLAIEYDIKPLILSRHYTLRRAMEELVNEVLKEHTYFKEKTYDMYNRRTDDYLAIGIDDHDICAISDLNNASDLKLRSNFLKKFDIIIYDEFLTLPEDYSGDEYSKIKVIYQSMDRNHRSELKNNDYVQIKHPKIFLLGNAVNFDSPILANLDIFEKMENFKINTTRKFENVIMEIRKNENTNKKRNIRAFKGDGDDSSDSAQFNFKRYKLATKKIKNEILKNYDEFVVQDEQTFIKVTYDKDTFKMILKIIPYSNNPYYCTCLLDQTDKCTYLNEKYFNPDFLYIHEKNDIIYYENSYTKTYVLKKLQFLNFILLTKRHKADNNTKHVELEEIVKNDYITRTLNRLVEELEG